MAQLLAMNRFNLNDMKKALTTTVWLVLAAGCTSTEEQPSDQTQNSNYKLGAPICSAWVHNHIENSTGDYQACKFNHRGKEAAVENCMIARGWRRENSEDACNIKSYSFEERRSCLKQSIVRGRVDHNRIAQCLAAYTPKSAAPLNRDKLKQMISTCMTYKDRLQQQNCLNQMMKKP